MPNVCILVVDDNNDFSILLSTFLSSIPGFEIVGIATDGLCAIKMIQETNPDVVLLDIVMPEADGLEVLRQIKHIGRNTPPVRACLISNGNEGSISAGFVIGCKRILS